MRVITPSEGYHLTAPGIKLTEDKYQATYMGPWAIRNKNGDWTDMPVDVFYVADPDRSKGHSNYFGIYADRIRDRMFICDAASAFSEPLNGILTQDGEVLISRYRHDCVTRGECMIDGGRDYLRSSCVPGTLLVEIIVQDGKFITKEVYEN